MESARPNTASRRTRRCCWNHSGRSQVAVICFTGATLLGGHAQPTQPARLQVANRQGGLCPHILTGFPLTRLGPVMFDRGENLGNHERIHGYGHLSPRMGSGIQNLVTYLNRFSTPPMFGRWLRPSFLRDRANSAAHSRIYPIQDAPKFGEPQAPSDPTLTARSHLERREPTFSPGASRVIFRGVPVSKSAGQFRWSRARLESGNVQFRLGGSPYQSNSRTVPRIGRHCTAAIGSWGAPDVHHPLAGMARG
jgi:hypothetical protein